MAQDAFDNCMSKFKGELLGFAMPLPEVEELPIFKSFCFSFFSYRISV